ncbi:hypothetical protein HOO34_01735 [Aliarcobacter cryaerophilus]|uniref:Uncharacterized protein n=1 Tax=Aliarcobacter cryaerophilus TaxID=28198 RepID=A0A7G9LPD5_9BACT|nr:hypothetical protein [Aliarcobacter cryaerophilus]MCT7534291.1 hypothetical protein [Aliarcobacter cryaerophilus]QNM90484.1 hypothetical protein HOO34_01735 [Aliarcobacter cryaerophilus]
MKVKGFGKKYFTLASIQAYATQSKLHAKFTALKTNINEKLKISSNGDEEDELSKDIEQNLLACNLINSKPCHCDCLFRRKTALAVRLFQFIPRCPFYCTFFAFRRTGVHPPQLSF